MTIEPKITRTTLNETVLFVPEKPIECIDHVDDAPTIVWFTVLVLIMCAVVLGVVTNDDSMEICLKKHSEAVCAHTLQRGL
jgi:hypothetical protein